MTRTLTGLVAKINALPPRQQEAFSHICIGQDGGHHPATVRALIRKGLVSEGLQRDTVKVGHYNVEFRIQRYDVASLEVHAAWAEWCAATSKEAPTAE